VYFVSSAIAIRVLACMHVKRDPRRWQRRVDRLLWHAAGGPLRVLRLIPGA